MVFTVATYNMRKAIGARRQRRPENIVEVLNEVGADVVALQEADRRFGARQSAIPPEMLAHSPYKSVPFDIRPGSLGWHGNALLVRKSVEILDLTPLTLPALEPRGAVLADLSIDGFEVRVVGMHLDLSGLLRRRQVRSVLEQIEARDRPLPTILMGDLNEWRAEGGCIRDFAHCYHVVPSGPSFHARRPVARLDRIIIGPGLMVEASGVHHSHVASLASDHLPVWAKLRPAGASSAEAAQAPKLRKAG